MIKELGLNERGYSDGSRVGERLLIASRIATNSARSAPAAKSQMNCKLNKPKGRVYHDPDNGWSVLRLFPFNNPSQQETVIVHQTKVFAGAGTHPLNAGVA